MMANRHHCCGSEPAGGDHDGCPGTTPSGRGRRGVGGAEIPTPASKRAGCSATRIVGDLPSP